MAKLAGFAIDPNQMWTVSSNATTSINLGSYTNIGWDFARDRPATNLEWLDNRINEMRVRL